MIDTLYRLYEKEERVGLNEQEEWLRKIIVDRVLEVCKLTSKLLDERTRKIFNLNKKQGD